MYCVVSLITKTSISRANYQEPIVEEPHDELPYYRIPRLEAPPAPVAAGISKVSKSIQKIRPRQGRGILRKEQRKNKKKPKGTFCRLCDTWCNSVATWRDHSRSRRHRAAVELKKNPPGDCQVCGIAFPSWDHHNSHFSGRKHHAKLARLQAERAAQLASFNRK